ncbi:MAG: hypothetical protein AAF667_04730 [Pseudomonadota bacterium]
MSDESRLSAKLSRLRGSVRVLPDGSRELFAVPPDELMVALLQEIDETVLARRLSFSTDLGGKLALDVSNRRLRVVRAVEFRAATADHREIVDMPLEQPGQTELDLLRDVFDAFLGGATSLRVRSDRVAVENPAEIVGCAAARMAAAWDLDLYAATEFDEEAMFEAFSSAAKPLSIAWIEARSSETATGGEAGDLDLLEEIGDQVEWEQTDEVIGQGAIEAYVRVLAFDEKGTGIVEAGLSDFAIRLLCAPDRGLEIAGLFQRGVLARL